MEREEHPELEYEFVEYPGFNVGNLKLNYLADYEEERHFTTVYLLFVADGNVAVLEGEKKHPEPSDDLYPADTGIADVIREAVETALATRRRAAK